MSVTWGPVGRGFGVASFIPTGPTVPTFTIVDEGDGTATVTVAGAIAGSTNVFYAAPRYAIGTGTTFTSYGSRTSDGDITATIVPGYYWGYIQSTYNSQTVISLVISFSIASIDPGSATNRYCDVACVTDCAPVFDKVSVWPQIAAGSTRIEWSLDPRFTDATPYVFQVQAGRTGLNDADDWVDVGTAITDTYFVVDSSRRAYGKFQWTHYRVKLTTDFGTYYSTPQNALGVLGFADWNRSRELLRLETLRLKQEAGQDGYLLKRKLFGTLCTCVDAETKEIKNPQHELCYGTGFVGGYYEPYPCFYVEQSNRASRSHIDAAMRGTVDDLPVVSGRMINIPQVFSYDVWVDKDTDLRWCIHKTQSIVEVRGVPLVISAEMRLLPFTDPVYLLDITGQVPS